MDNSYDAIMARKNEIIKNAVGMDFEKFEKPGIGFDYEAMMEATGYTIEEIRRVQSLFSIGNTPLIELKNLTELARKCAPAGKGARIFIKDEASNHERIPGKEARLQGRSNSDERQLRRCRRLLCGDGGS